MPLEIQFAVLRPDETKVFTFSGPIAQRMVGISQFELAFSKDDHHVQRTAISLSVNQQGNTLSVNPHASMVDAGGRNLDAGKSSVTVVAVAWVGIDNPSVRFANVGGIADNGASAPQSVPCNSPLVLQSVLAGFDLSFGKDDHHMETALASVGNQLNGNSSVVTGLAKMSDASGNNASTATVDGGLVASCDRSLRMAVMASNSLQFGAQTLQFPADVSRFVSLLTGFKVQFKNEKDHHVKTFKASFLIDKIQDHAVTVVGSAGLSDGSGNEQDNTISNVTGVVIGY